MLYTRLDILVGNTTYYSYYNMPFLINLIINIQYRNVMNSLI